tara:strand:+ start:522 stop:866 length:345 start_codon:yes stop_codon:yes gene_type:complete
MSRRLKKVECEICGIKEIEVLHKHHITERTEIDTSNHLMNLAVICSNCHNKVHAGRIEIVGLFPSTKLPYRRTLVYVLDGKPNIEGITEPYFKHVPKQSRLDHLYEEEKEKKVN